jgi:hypothetical protein
MNANVPALVLTAFGVAILLLLRRFHGRSRREPRFAGVLTVWILAGLFAIAGTYDLLRFAAPLRAVIEFVVAGVVAMLGLSVYRSLPPDK